MKTITGIGEVADVVGGVIDRIWPNKTEQERAELQAAMLVVQGQLKVNEAEAGSSSAFVAGWRPFIGWVCGAACARPDTGRWLAYSCRGRSRMSTASA